MISKYPRVEHPNAMSKAFRLKLPSASGAQKATDRIPKMAEPPCTGMASWGSSAQETVQETVGSRRSMNPVLRCFMMFLVVENSNIPQDKSIFAPMRLLEAMEEVKI